MNLKFLFVIIQWILAPILHSAELFRDFEILTCSQQRNITIVMHGVNINLMERFFRNLNELVQNDACFKVSFHLPYEYRVISWQETFDLNHIKVYNYREGFLSNHDSDKYILDLLKSFNENKFVVRKTFVLMIGWYTNHEQLKHYFPLLKKLQNTNKLDVIIYCFLERCPEDLWIPSNRLIITDIGYPYFIDPYEAPKVKDLLDVMKEPNFDRYGFAYQSILSRKDFFNETCLKGITKIYMEFSRFHDGYFKNAVAILRMVY